VQFWLKTRLTLALLAASQALAAAPSFAQNRPVPVRTAYSALSAGIGTLWLTQEQGYFKKHGLDSNLMYIRGGSTAVQALLAGEIQFGHLSPAPMLAAWAQGADFVWIGTTTHQMVFTLIVDGIIAKGVDLKGKKIGITRIGSASDLALRTALEQFGLGPKEVTMIALGGIPEILAAMRAEDRILDGGCKECSGAISSPPYPELKGLEAVRDSLVDSAPLLRNADLRKFVDDRFVRAR